MLPFTYWNMTGAISVTGGGAPRLYLVSQRQAYTPTTGTPGTTRVTAYRLSVSTDFGETFKPGIDVGAQDSAGTPIHDGTQWDGFPTAGCYLTTFPGGRLWFTGIVIDNSTGTYQSHKIKAPRLTDDSTGRTGWRNATQGYVASPDASGYLYDLSLCWTTTGGNEAAKGGGGRAHGGYVILTPAIYFPNWPTYDGSAQAWGRSLDGGDTWGPATDLSNSQAITAGALSLTGYACWYPNQQPQAVWGLAIAGNGASVGDFAGMQRIEQHPWLPGYEPNTWGWSSLGWDARDITHPSGGTIHAYSADTERVSWIVYNGALAGGSFIGSWLPGLVPPARSQLIIAETRRSLQGGLGGDFNAYLPAHIFIAGAYSETNDGLNLRPILSGGQYSQSLWCWNGNYVYAVADGETIQVYKSDNGGLWFRRTVHSASAGATWATEA